MIFKRTTNRYGETPIAETPYARAGQVWDQRLGSARVQAKNWRYMAFACFLLACCLSAALVWQSQQSTITPYVVEVDKLGEVRTVGPATQAYEPSDAQIAYHLANFIKGVRSVSVDPVVLREQWLSVYDFATDRASLTLNEYANENDPFADVGRRSVSVEITSVVRASNDSFQVKWIERHYRNGAFQKLERYTAILTIVFQPPIDAATLRKNPLGLYVHGLNWSRDLDQGEQQ